MLVKIYALFLNITKTLSDLSLNTIAFMITISILPCLGLTKHFYFQQLLCLAAFPHLLFPLLSSPSALKVFLMGLFSFACSKSFRISLNENLLVTNSFFVL